VLLVPLVSASQLANDQTYEGTPAATPPVGNVTEGLPIVGQSGLGLDVLPKHGHRSLPSEFAGAG
jgi:hypothetical protein